MTSHTKISEIEFIPIKPQNGLLGFVSFVVDGKFWMGSVAIYVRRDGGYRLVYPSRKVGQQQVNTFHPINQEIGLLVEQAVSEKVNEVLDENREHIEPEKSW